jgi:class 3 adenylate cyclase/tetratricopeptide (TPR) repeat protein
VTIGAHRKVVTVLFCDVVGSTALGESVDPEALQAVLARYFERMRGIVESHGGSVEKFIGDAVMAVFGVPAAHEDDALRACRAAVEMRNALPELGVEGRIGVNTGEVLTGTEERLATGDAVNVAARLEQAAEPGEVLVGAVTLALVGAAVEVGEERLLELKGKSEPVAARPLVAVHETEERSHASPFVGREREVGELVHTWQDRALAGSRCELLTVVGDPGVGKSRLVAEALGQIDARVVRGRCLNYGEGITYWPVVEVVKQLAALPSDEAAARAIRSLLGESDEISGTDEIAWAFRKLLEEQAPLVVSFDDLQWGEETFLDLVESTALLSTGAPLLLLCMARPELLDRRPTWPATLKLEPLPEKEAVALVGASVQDEVRDQIVRASGGNPLFVTEMLALASEGGDVEVPATLWALLAARLDQLDDPERKVLEWGAVEGELFHRGTVQALAPEETEVTPRLAALVRRDLVRPDRPLLPHEDAYRFRHLLIRDAAYDALPKATRADLHRRFAIWLEEHGNELVELDEILGYHLEQSALYLEELGRPDAEVALAAGERLGLAGRRAHSRRDSRAAVSLLDRALVMTRPHRLNVHLEVDLAESLWSVDLPRAVRIADDAAVRAEGAGDRVGAALAQTVAAKLRAWFEASADEVEPIARKALPLLEEAGDDAGLASVWDALALVANMHARCEDWARAGEAAVTHTRRAGQTNVHMFGLSVALALGPRPAGEALATLDALLPEQPYSGDLLVRALLLAMLGRTAEARAVAQPAWEHARELGQHFEALWLAEVLRLAGDLPAAAAYLETSCDALEESGSTGPLEWVLSRYACVLCDLGRFDEAEAVVAKERRLADSDDVSMQTNWRSAQALVHSSRGQRAEGERFAGEAVSWASRSDSPVLQGEAFESLAVVLGAAGRREEAIAAWREALDRYEQKQVIPLAHRVREQLAALEPV